VTRLKGGHSGENVLSDRQVKALRAYLRKRGRDGGSLFRSRQGTITRRRLDQLMKRYGADAGVPPEKRHFHCLRHSCATSLLSKHRQTIDKVKDILGHEDIRNTMIYAQLTNAERTRIGAEAVPAHSPSVTTVRQRRYPVSGKLGQAGRPVLLRRLFLFP